MYSSSVHGHTPSGYYYTSGVHGISCISNDKALVIHYKQLELPYMCQRKTCKETWKKLKLIGNIQIEMTSFQETLGNLLCQYVSYFVSAMFPSEETSMFLYTAKTKRLL